jgi:hypothetical protein
MTFLGYAFFYLAASAISMASLLNYKSVHNQTKLQERLSQLSYINAWFPLNPDDSYLQRTTANGGKLMPLWDFVSLPKTDFINLLNADPANLRWATAFGQRWSCLLDKWEVPACYEIKRHHGTIWVNFSPDQHVSLKPFFDGVASVHQHADMFFPDPSRPFPLHKDGWEFITNKRSIGNLVDTTIESSGSPASNFSASDSSVQALNAGPASESEQTLAGSTFVSTLTPREIQEILNIDITSLESGDGAVSIETWKQVHRVMNALKKPDADDSNIKFIEIPSSATPNHRKETWVFFPSTYVEDGAAGSKTISNRSKILEWASKKIGAGIQTISKLIRRDKVFTEAAEKSGVSCYKLSIEQTLQLQSKMNVSHTAMRELSAMLKEIGAPLKLASQPKCRALLDSMHLSASYYEQVPLAGSGGTVNCLVYAVNNACDAAQRDLDNAVATRDFKLQCFPCDSASTLPVLNFMAMNDWGGKSDKHVLRSLNVGEHVCSAKHCTIIASAETMRADQTTKPSGCWENFGQVLGYVDGLTDFESNCVAQLGGRHVFFPAHTRPDLMTWTTIAAEDEPAFYRDIYAGTDGTPAERAQRRSQLEPNSATFIVIGSKCLGVRASSSDGFSTFPFREPVIVNPNTQPSPTIFKVHLFLSSDLLALCVLIGNPGQAGCSCPLCRCDAKGFKIVAADPTKPDLQERTTPSQLVDLNAFQSKTSSKPTPVNGVSRPALYNFDFRRLIPPVLHLVLGLTNDVMQSIYKELLVWDGLDPGAAVALTAALTAREDCDLNLSKSLSTASELLGASHPLVLSVIGRVDTGVVVSNALSLEQFESFVEALVQAADIQETEAAELGFLPPKVGGHSSRALANAAKKAAAPRAKAEELRGIAPRLPLTVFFQIFQFITFLCNRCTCRFRRCASGCKRGSCNGGPTASSGDCNGL